MNAGGDTTYRGTSVLLTGLLTHPEQLAAVAADRNLIPQAIDEALRWEGPVTSTFRYAAQDTEIEGMPIRKRSEEHTSELQSLMRISYAVFCLKKKNQKQTQEHYER